MDTIREHVDDIVTAVQAADILRKKKNEVKEKSNTLWIVLGIIGAVVVIALIAYAVYRYMTPSYIDDFDDEFDDDFEDEDFDDDTFDAAPET